jgi:signal transduction histidine kinase
MFYGKKNKVGMSLRTTLILWYSGLLAVIIVMFGAAVFGVMRWALVSGVDRTLESTIDNVRRNSRASVIGQFDRPRMVAIDLPELDTFGWAGVLVQVWDINAATPRLLRASANIDDYRDPLDRAALSRTRASNQTGQDYYSNIIKNGTEWRVLTESVSIWGGEIAIQVAVSSQPIKAASKVLLTIMLGSGVFGILMSIGLGMWLSSRALIPINRVTAAAARIAATDDLSTRLPWDGPKDEIGRLTGVFNNMMARLEHLFSVQQRFVGDVSHELRTPLTAIRGNLDIAKRYGMDDETMDAVTSEVDRMARMVKDLLLLARADYGELKVELEPVDLDTIVTEVFREARILAKDRDLTVKIVDYEPVRINGNGDRLKQLLLNLVSNALKFTPDGGEIMLNLRLEDYDAVLEVRDTGIGICEADQKRIFDRFFQADESRARQQGAEGVGLGLSIAAWIVEAHRGSITVESEMGMGTTFIIKLPAIVETPQVSSQAATRPRLGIIRRNLPQKEHKEKVPQEI